MPDFTPTTILLDSCCPDRFSASWRFNCHIRTLVAETADQVVSVLQQAEAATRQGLYAVGFVAYEAAQALNPHLRSLTPQNGLPLAWFALFRERRAVSAGEGLPAAATNVPALAATCSQAEHRSAIAAIHRAIEQGETYQINHTFPIEGQWQGDPLQLYRRLLDAQRPAFGAYIDTGLHIILSASPELFFHRQGKQITTRPMKGTAPRGRFPAEDQKLADHLHQSSKERAENLMIVDLLRNDLGQIAQTGSVQVDQLFALETYPTVHQLTSSISAQLRPGIGLADIFRALFPCGSVTGAPKRRSMELIAQIEGQPRGIYCGAIGMLSPGDEAIFSVAIRTVLLDRQSGQLSMGVGSGITWDAAASAEYAECLAKAAFLAAPRPARLVESLRLEDGRYPLLRWHLARLAWSASRLGHRYDADRIKRCLLQHADKNSGTRKVRLLLAVDGQHEIMSEPIEPDRGPLRLAISTSTVDPRNQALYLKTEDRTRYDAARAEHPGADEVLLVNTRKELTEGSYHNLVLRLYGRLVTPPLSCGLLPGVMRQKLVDSATLREQVLYPTDLLQAEEIWLINAVRGWRRAELIS